jgi:hypothetical protein
MTEHSEFEHQRLNKDEFKLFNEELYSTISCVVADLLWHKHGVEGKCPKCNHDTKGGGWLYGNLISECGVLSMEPNDDVSCQFKNPPSGKDFALTLLMSSDSYHEALRNVNFGSFDKKTLFYILNYVAPEYGSIEGADDTDSFQIERIDSFYKDGGHWIDRIWHVLHSYGSYTLPMADILKNPSGHNIFEVVSLILDNTVEEGMNMGSWKPPNESEVLSIIKNMPQVNSVESLFKYSKNLGLDYFYQHPREEHL